MSCISVLLTFRIFARLGDFAGAGGAGARRLAARRGSAAERGGRGRICLPRRKRGQRGRARRSSAAGVPALWHLVAFHGPTSLEWMMIWAWRSMK